MVLRRLMFTLGLLAGAPHIEGAPIHPEFFPQTVYPALQKAGCAGCHSEDGVASGTRLHFPESDASPARIQEFGNSLGPLVDRAHPEASLLLNKPTRKVPHAGGQRIAPGSPEEAVLREWVNYLASLPAGAPEALGNRAVEAVKRTPVLRRLTHAQYNNTVRDLLGDDSRLSDQFPPEDFVNGFKDQYQAQSISPLLAEAYSAAAEKLARNAFRAGDTHHLIPCKPKGPGDAACRDAFLQAFGRRAFRRPLGLEEQARYAKLFDGEGTAARNFLSGAQLVVEGMLQSPAFLSRTENGADKSLQPYETASRLSYFLWNSAPDPGLMRSAEAGELQTAAGLEAVARKMLKDPRAAGAVDEFVSQWLRFDRASGMVKDRRIFPIYTPEMTAAMTEEPRRLVADLVWNNGDFTRLFSARYGFLNSDLAAIYGLPAPPSEFARVDLPESTGRAGVLGQALFLALTSKPEETSPTARGLFVREQFLCQEVPPPPPGVNTNLPALTKETPKSSRERLATHTTNESCKSCHSLIDPIGFGLEKYDALGQKREKLTITFFPEHGAKSDKAETAEVPLNTDGYIAGIPESQFSSPSGLGDVLARSQKCQECVVKQLFRYAAGRKETANDRIIIEKAYGDFKASGFRFQELMVSLSKLLVFPPGGKESDGTTAHSGTH